MLSHVRSKSGHVKLIYHNKIQLLKNMFVSNNDKDDQDDQDDQGDGGV